VTEKEKWHRLKAPTGCDCANHSGFQPFLIRDGHIDCSACAIEGFFKVGGFTMVGESPSSEITVSAPSEDTLRAVEAAIEALGEPATDHPSAEPELVAQVISTVLDAKGKWGL
jgi:hypothetical protein